MSPDIIEELRTAFRAFLSGAWITVVYDLIRIFRRMISHGNFWIGVEDLFFWIWTSLWIFSVLYRENDGTLRMYTMIAMALGMIAYHWTVGEPVVKFLGKVLKKIKTGIIMKLEWRSMHGNKDQSKKKN